MAPCIFLAYGIPFLPSRHSFPAMPGLSFSGALAPCSDFRSRAPEKPLCMVCHARCIGFHQPFTGKARRGNRSGSALRTRSSNVIGAPLFVTAHHVRPRSRPGFPGFCAHAGSLPSRAGPGNAPVAFRLPKGRACPRLPLSVSPRPAGARCRRGYGCQPKTAGVCAAHARVWKTLTCRISHPEKPKRNRCHRVGRLSMAAVPLYMRT